MAFVCNVAFAFQIVSIVAGCFGIIVAIVCLIKWFSVPGLIMDIFVILFSLIIIASEVYVFDFFKYFAFILVFWGKAIFYLFMGFLLFSTSGIGLVAAIIFWALFIAYIILHFVFHITSVPIMQKNSPPSFETSNTDYFNDGAAAESKA